MSADNPQRKVGILTENQRRYLRGEKEDMTERSEQQLQLRIRQRIRNALIDASLLFKTLDDQAIEQVFWPEPNANESRKDVIEGTIDLLALCSMGMGKAAIPFELALQEAMKRAGVRQGTPVDLVEFDVDYNQPSDKAFDRVTVMSEESYRYLQEIKATQEELLEENVERGQLEVEELSEKEVVTKIVEEWLAERDVS
jgi:hypothetical protein